MRTVLRILVILAVAAVVVGAAVALQGSGGATDQGGLPSGQRGFGRQAQSEGAPEGFGAGGPRGGEGGRDYDEAGGLFGLATVLKNLVLVSLIVLVVTQAGRGWKALLRTLDPTPGA